MGRNPTRSRGVGPAVVDRPLDEAELVERARHGDLEAWETLVRRYQGIAFRTAYLLAGNAGDAEEAAQDGFVKAYRALGRFRAGSPFRPWLLQIVASEDRERLLAAVNGLREEERLVIACRFFLELSEDETAAALDIRPGTVKSRTSRALDHLRKTYA